MTFIINIVSCYILLRTRAFINFEYLRIYFAFDQRILAKRREIKWKSQFYQLIGPRIFKIESTRVFKNIELRVKDNPQWIKDESLQLLRRLKSVSQLWNIYRNLETLWEERETPSFLYFPQCTLNGQNSFSNGF